MIKNADLKMSTKNKSVASQALMEMDSIISAVKEESKKTLGSLLNEAVRDALREGCCDDDDDEEKDYDVIDGETSADDNDEEKPKKTAKSDVDEEDADEGVDPSMQNQQGGQTPQGNDQMGGDDMSGDMGGQEAPADDMGGDQMGADQASGEGEDEGWDDYSKYQVGDDTYDLTGENDYDNVVKVYKLLKDDDQVVVKKDGNTVQLQDGAAGTEYVIDLGSDDEDAEAQAVEGEDGAEDGAMPQGGEQLSEGIYEIDANDSAGFTDDEFDDEDDFDFNDDDFESVGDEPEDDFEESDMDSNLNTQDFDGQMGMQALSDNPAERTLGQSFGVGGNSSVRSSIDTLQQKLDALKSQVEPSELAENKNRKSRKLMKESKEVLFEVDLGYTDNYQDKDPIKGLNNNEPSKSGKSWHKGVPTGTAKPWAGETKSKGDPFKKTQKVAGSVNEMDDMGMGDDMPEIGADQMGTGEVAEANLSQSRWNDTHANGNRVPAANEDEYRRKGMQKTHKGNEYRATSSANESKMVQTIMKENKELKKAVVALKKNLQEAYMTNVNLGKITKLFLENTTSQAEKIDIVNRFTNEAKTAEQSKALYESISRELKKANKAVAITEGSVTAKGTKALNENKVYKSDDLLKTIDLMNRMGNC